MQGRKLKAADIAEICGISEDDVKRIAEEYPQAVHTSALGRIKIYEENSVEAVKKISDLERRGCQASEICEKLGFAVRKPSTKERVEAHKNKIEGAPANLPQTPGLKSEGLYEEMRIRTAPVKHLCVEQEKGYKLPDGRFTAELDPLEAVRGNIGGIEAKLSNIVRRLDDLEAEIRKTDEKFQERLNELDDLIRSLEKRSDVWGEWTDSFEKSLESYRTAQESAGRNFAEWRDWTETKVGELKAAEQEISEQMKSAEYEISELKKPFWARNKD